MAMYDVNHPIHRLLIEGVRKGPKAHREAVKIAQATYHESCHFVMDVHEGQHIIAVDIGVGTKAGRGAVWPEGRRSNFWKHPALSDAMGYAAGIAYETWSHGGYFVPAIASYDPDDKNSDVAGVKHYLRYGNLDGDDDKSFWRVLNDTERKLSELWPVIDFVAGSIQVGRKGQTFKPSARFQERVAQFIRRPEELSTHAPWSFFYTDVPYRFIERLRLLSSETEYPDEEFAQYTDLRARDWAGADISAPIQRRGILTPSPQKLSAQKERTHPIGGDSVASFT